jgi:rhodanese-related sulfurtransferase
MLGFGTPTPEVRVDDAHRLAAAGHRLVDVRDHDEFAAGHAPGAVHIPLGDLSHRVGDLDPAVGWLAICRSGARSRQATALLGRHGLSVRNVAGGMNAWLRSRLPVQDALGRAGRVI